MRFMRSIEWSRELLAIIVFFAIIMIILTSFFLARYIIISSPQPYHNNDSTHLMTAMQGYNIVKNAFLSQHKDVKLVGIDDVSNYWPIPIINGSSYSWDYYILSMTDGKYYMVKTYSSDDPGAVLWDTLSPDELHKIQNIHSDTDLKCDSDNATMTAMSLYHNITGMEPTYFNYYFTNTINSTTGKNDFYWIIGLATNCQKYINNGWINFTSTNRLYTYVDAETGAILYYDYTNKSIDDYTLVPINDYTHFPTNASAETKTLIDSINSSTIQYIIHNSNNTSEALTNYFNNIYNTY